MKNFLKLKKYSFIPTSTPYGKSKYCLEIILKRSGLTFQDLMLIANQIEVKKFKIYVMYSKLLSYKFPFFGIFQEIDLASLFTQKLQKTLWVRFPISSSQADHPSMYFCKKSGSVSLDRSFLAGRNSLSKKQKTCSFPTDNIF